MIVLKAGHISDSAICKRFVGRCLHEQAPGGMPLLGLRLVTKKTFKLFMKCSIGLLAHLLSLEGLLVLPSPFRPHAALEL